MLKQFVLPFTLLLFSATSLAEDLNYNQISLQATASQEVTNDLLTTVLTVQENGANPTQLSQRVNTRMTQILGIAKQSTDVKSHTTSYNTQPMYKNNKINGWQVRQQIKLVSQNIKQLTDLIAKLNKLAHVQSMSFGISDKLSATTKEKLTKAAIKKFRTKAQVITEQFDKSTYQLIHASIDANAQHYRNQPMRMERMAMSDAAVAPAVSAGTNKITVTVNGSIELSD